MKTSFFTWFFAKEVVVLPIAPAGFSLLFLHQWQYAWIASLCIYVVGMVVVRHLLNSKPDA